MKNALLKLLALCIIGLAASGCTSTRPASVAGECGILGDPGFAVQGKRLKDQRWIDRTQEGGIASCGWARPKAD
jgi:hypothetical protein